MPPPVVARIISQHQALLHELSQLEQLAADQARPDRVGEAMAELRRSLFAHNLVGEGLLVASLRRCGEFRASDLAALGAQYDELERLAAEAEDSGCRASALARLAEVLRAHIEDERRVALAAASSAAAVRHLARIPSTLLGELHECSGGRTETWSEYWLG